jgi:hypothetical protein
VLVPLQAVSLDSECIALAASIADAVSIQNAAFVPLETGDSKLEELLQLAHTIDTALTIKVNQNLYHHDHAAFAKCCAVCFTSCISPAIVLICTLYDL